MGKPLGQAFGHSTGDPPSFAYPYMWAYGAMEVEEDGKTVAFNKDTFVEGMNTFIQAWKDAFDETGLSWDDSANNRAFLSDQISATMNGSSIYLAAQKAKSGADTGTDYKVVVDPADINHAGLPAGPAGRFNALASWSYGVMKYSKNQDAGKAFLEWWLSPDQYKAWLNAQKGYIIPPVPNYASLPVFVDDPKLAPYLDVVNYGRNKGYAGPTNQNAARVSSQYIITDTFAKAIQTGDAKGSIEEGAKLLERIYGR
jgi:multiple sugar transport system substrate-binding protein